MDEVLVNASYYFRVATYLNSHPEEIEDFFERSDSLEVFANIYGMLKSHIRAKAVKIANRLIIKIARHVADSGYRSGNLILVRGFYEGTDIDLDRSVENYIEEPDRGLLENIASFTRQKERKAFVIMFDHSYSMKGIKIILAAITAATIAQHFKKDYAIVAFSNRVTVLKSIDDKTGPEEVLEKLFALELQGDTDMHAALNSGLQQLDNFGKKIGLILTDGAWNQGGDPLAAAARFDKLNVIAFPPAKTEKVSLLALKGKGEFVFVENEGSIAKAILRCLN